MNADKTSKTEVGLKLTRCSNCGALDGQRPVSGSPSPRRFWPSGLKYGYARILRLSSRFSRPSTSEELTRKLLIRWIERRPPAVRVCSRAGRLDRKSTRLNSSHLGI